MGSHLACLGLAPEEPPFDDLMDDLLRHGRDRALEDGWTTVTFTDHASGARVVFGVDPDDGVPLLVPSFAPARPQPFRLTRGPSMESPVMLGELTLSGIGLAVDLADPLAFLIQGESGTAVALTLLAEAVRPATAGEDDTFAPVGLLAVGTGEPEPAALAIGTVLRSTMRWPDVTDTPFLHVELGTPAGTLDVCCDPDDLRSPPRVGSRLVVEAYVVGALQ